MIEISGSADTKSTVAAMSKLVKEVEAVTFMVSMRQAAAVLERAAKLKLTENGRHKPNTPTPSPPGSAPAVVTGALRASIKSGKPRRKGFGMYAVFVGPTVIYGRVQELGNGTTLPARPYMAPAYRESAPEIHRVYAEVWKRSLK